MVNPITLTIVDCNVRLTPVQRANWRQQMIDNRTCGKTLVRETAIEIAQSQIGAYTEVNGYQVSDVTLTTEQQAKLREHLEGVSPAAISYILTGEPEDTADASD